MLSKYTSDKFPNTHIEFTQEGVKLTITINVPRNLTPYLPKNKVQKKNKFYVYWVRDLINKPTIGGLTKTYNDLLKKAMINIRNAKIKKLQDEQKRIKQRSLFTY